MARRPPSITSVMPQSDGGLKVSWTTDQFFPDSEPGDNVRIDLNGVEVATADGTDTEAELEAATVSQLPGQVVHLSVSYIWDGSPSEELQSTVTLQRAQGASGAASSGVYPATQPVVTVDFVKRRTLSEQRQIGISWSADNYNGGRFSWGPDGNPAQFQRSINPRGTRYGGSFVTDQPLEPDTLYRFNVEVRNTLHSPGWLSTPIVVRSAPQTGSVRRFLEWSGRAPGSLVANFGSGAQLRAVLFG